MQITANQFRLSPQQKRLFALGPDNHRRRIQAACLIEGQLDHQAFRRSFQTVLERHEAFRTRFRSVPGLKFPLQEVMDEARWQEFAPSDWGPHGTELDFSALLDREREQHGCVSEDAPLCFTLIPFDGTGLVLVVSAPAGVADSLTVRNLIAELVLALEPDTSARVDSDLPVQYADYSVWRSELEDQDPELAEEARAYWRNNFNTEVLDCRLPGQVPAPPGLFVPRSVPVCLDEEVAERLASLARRESVSLESVLLACWGILLHRLIESKGLAIGVKVDGRSHEELRTGMGLYAQTIPVSMSFPRVTFLEIVRQSDLALSQATLWQDYFQWPEKPDGSPQYCPLSFRYYPPAQIDRAGGTTFSICAEEGEADRFELQLACSSGGARLKGVIAFDPACLSFEQAEQLARRWEIICAGAAEQNDLQIRQLPVLTSRDQSCLLDDWNRTGDDALTPACIHDCFEHQVERTPDAVAVVCEDQALSYRELNRRANRLARRLCSLSVRAETPVCLFVGRSTEMLVGLLGILKAGGAYVPLDTAYPVKERIAHIIKDTGSPVIVTHERMRRHVPEGLCEVISLDADPRLVDQDAENLGAPCAPDNLVYIIYTSGSTGKPKGVMVQHGSVVNLWGALRKLIYDRHRPNPHRVTLNAPASFDASVKQILLLMGGHTLHVIPEEVRGTPDSFVEYLRESRIDVLDCTPSHLRLLLDAGLVDCDREAPSIGLVGGEAIDGALWRRLACNGATRFYNVYGPTECTGDSTGREITLGSEHPTIGTPLANVQAYVLNEHLQLELPGVSGELCISGAGLARGYWNRPELSAVRFTPHPFACAPGERIYRTGDIARYFPGGSLEYLGRIDHQVKIRGFRVELGEISAALLQHSEIREAVVIALEDNSGSNRLVAYVVPAAGSKPAPSDLRRHLEGQLPEYMVPAAYLILTALPLTTNNKIDRDALPVPEEIRPGLCSDFQAPERPVEIALAAIWESVLGVKQVGRRDNFFELGGHSLLAMQVISRVRKEFAVNIVLPRLFQKPTVEGLAQVVEESLGRQGQPHTVIPALPRGAKGFEQFRTRLNALTAGN